MVEKKKEIQERTLNVHFSEISGKVFRFHETNKKVENRPTPLHTPLLFTRLIDIDTFTHVTCASNTTKLSRYANLF